MTDEDWDIFIQNDIARQKMLDKVKNLAKQDERMGPITKHRFDKSNKEIWVKDDQGGIMAYSISQYLKKDIQ